MDIFYQIFLSALKNQQSQVIFPDLSVSPAELVEMQCYAAVQKIRKILADKSLEDPECFQQIEEIVCTLEELGLSGGGRHDFG